MTSKAIVEEFVAQRTWAVVGASRDRKKFGNMAYRNLKTKGYRLFPVNPNAEEIEGDRCYPNLKALPERVDAVLIVTPPAETERIVRDAAEANMRRVWMQQGAESDAAVKFCEASGITEVHGQCIMMFARDTGFGHRAHRWVWGMLGKLPK
jgi:predicted CoA-binding protein